MQGVCILVNRIIGIHIYRRPRGGVKATLCLDGNSTIFLVGNQLADSGRRISPVELRQIVKIGIAVGSAVIADPVCLCIRKVKEQILLIRQLCIRPYEYIINGDLTGLGVGDAFDTAKVHTDSGDLFRTLKGTVERYRCNDPGVTIDIFCMTLKSCRTGGAGCTSLFRKADGQIGFHRLDRNTSVLVGGFGFTYTEVLHLKADLIVFRLLGCKLQGIGILICGGIGIHIYRRPGRGVKATLCLDGNRIIGTVGNKFADPGGRIRPVQLRQIVKVGIAVGSAVVADPIRLLIRKVEEQRVLDRQFFVGTHKGIVQGQHCIQILFCSKAGQMEDHTIDLIQLTDLILKLSRNNNILSGTDIAHIKVHSRSDDIGIIRGIVEVYRCFGLGTHKSCDLEPHLEVFCIFGVVIQIEIHRVGINGVEACNLRGNSHRACSGVHSQVAVLHPLGSATPCVRGVEILEVIDIVLIPLLCLCAVVEVEEQGLAEGVDGLGVGVGLVILAGIGHGSFGSKGGCLGNRACIGMSCCIHDLILVAVTATGAGVGGIALGRTGRSSHNNIVIFMIAQSSAFPSQDGISTVDQLGIGFIGRAQNRSIGFQLRNRNNAGIDKLYIFL